MVGRISSNGVDRGEKYTNAVNRIVIGLRGGGAFEV